jgi:spore coat protein U-like protein
MISRTGAIVFVVALLAVAPPRPPTIDADTASMRAVATVGRSCLIDSGPLVFGEYDPVERNVSIPLDTEAIIVVNCTRGTPSAVSLDGGQHATGAQRNLANGADLLRYDLFQDQSHSIPWGNTPGNVLVLGSSDGNPLSVRVFGRVPANQDIRVGSYTDSIVATVVF